MFTPDASATYHMTVENWDDEGTRFRVTLYNVATQCSVHQDVYTLAWVARAFRPANITLVTMRAHGATIDNTMRHFATSKGAEFNDMRG